MKYIRSIKDNLNKFLTKKHSKMEDQKMYKIFYVHPVTYQLCQYMPDKMTYQDAEEFCKKQDRDLHILGCY